MSQPHDDTAPVDHDPTGMRALLASLPEPGPMPGDLVARISAALAVEAQRGDGIDQLWGLDESESESRTTSSDGQDDGGRVVPLRRRVQLRHLGVAAAVVGVLGLGGFFVRNVPGDIGASVSASDASSDPGVAQEFAAGSKAGAPLVAPAAGSGEVVVVMSGVDHASARLDVTARQLDDGTLDPIADLSVESPTLAPTAGAQSPTPAPAAGPESLAAGPESLALGPVATPAGARSCATALGVPADAGILVDVSEVDGVSAAVLVVHSDHGRTAWAVDRSCTTGAPQRIIGPVPLD